MANLPENTGCGCPEGYELRDNECVLETTVPANYSGGLLTVTEGDKAVSYSKYGLRLYPDISSAALPIVGSGSGSAFKLYEDFGTGSELVPTISSIQSTLWGADGSIGSPANLAGCSNTASSEGFGGRLNTVGLWATGAPLKPNVINNWNLANPANLYSSLTVEQQLDVLDPAKISFEFCVDLVKEKQYLIGIAGDNECFLEIDGVKVLYLGNPATTGNFADGNQSTVQFNYWHVFPVTIPAGQRTIKLSGINYYDKAAFGAEIYDINLATFQSNLTTAYTASPDCGNTPADPCRSRTLYYL
jgi:hypothetical protein